MNMKRLGFQQASKAIKEKKVIKSFVKALAEGVRFKLTEAFLIFVKSFCQKAMVSKDYWKQLIGDHFTAKPKVGMLRNLCQAQGKCRFIDFFSAESPHLTMDPRQAQ